MELLLTRQEPPEAATALLDADTYRAFHAVDQRQLCQLRPVGQCWQDVAYRTLLRVIRDIDNRGRFLILVFSSIGVVAQGQNLQRWPMPLARGIDSI